jgi:hypothetical protein
VSTRAAIGIGLCLAWALGVQAAEDVTLTAEVDARQVGVADQVELTISVSGRSLDLVVDITVPAMTNLRVVSGPHLSTQFSFVNGAVSQAKTYTYVLQPRAVGKAEIGAVRAQLRGGMVKTTAPIPIDVAAGSVRPAPAPQSDPFSADPFGEDPFDGIFGGGRRPPARATAPKLRVEVEAARQKVYVGEPVLLTYRLYTQIAVTDVQFAESPKYPGFWSEEISRAAGGVRGELVTYEGERYQRFAVLERLLFPTKRGRLTIPPATLRVALAQQGFFAFNAAPVDRQTRAIAIEALPIPEAPGFSGAVGGFKASASVDRSAIDLGEAVTLRFTLSGRGNLKWIDKGPELTLPGAKTFPPQIKDDVKVTTGGMSGSRTWEYVLVPETTGGLTVPPLALAYFDPASGQLAQAASAPLTIDVRGGTGVPGAGTAAVSRRPAEASASGHAGLPLRSELDESVRVLPSLGSRELALIAACTALAHVLLLVGGARRGRLGRRRQGPARTPRVSLRAALADVRRAERDAMSKERAAGLIEKALGDVFGDLTEREPRDEREFSGRALLDEARFLRYAPQLGDYGEKIRELAARAEEVIRRHG